MILMIIRLEDPITIIKRYKEIIKTHKKKITTVVARQEKIPKIIMESEQFFETSVN